MEGAANSSDLQSQLPFINQNNSFCRNLTDNTSFSERRCGDGGLTSRLDEDANPVIIAIIITALYSIVCMVGLVGNVLVMYIIVRFTVHDFTHKMGKIKVAAQFLLLYFNLPYVILRTNSLL
ncbi:hypothetical protein XENOCAPTIV_024465 [Xenoophorus captivus]|uniref:G-protein coupled receptors family 1 profile domain-containing protein n=1 Tax=Xenoophorus captivus TaxID=1517983 RepID=A0ABV0S5B3_9TELE